MKLTNALLFYGLAWWAAGCTSIPPSLQPSAGERHLETWQAKGQWVYHCRLSNDGSQQTWATLRPQAQLRDANGQTVGRMEMGPNLVHRDGSVAELSVRDRHPQAAALPWMLYAASPAAAPGAGNGPPVGVLAKVSSVQLIQSVGGAQPTEGCSSGDQLMAERAIPFTAELRLFGR